MSDAPLRIGGTAQLTYFCRYEFQTVVKVTTASPLFKAKIAELKLPEGFEVIIEPWPYGAPDPSDGKRRFFQALCFAHDKRTGNPDTNFYAYPLPLIPVMDAHKKEIVRIDALATGGKADGLYDKTHLASVIDHCKTSEYVPELVEGGLRNDLKPLSVIQPEGASFTVTDGNLIEWQKWRMRVTFNPREGAVVHDVTYDGRSILYRLSMSDMVSSVLTGKHQRKMLTEEPERTVCRRSAAFPPEAGV